jgi:hypothetical protein
MAYRFYPKYCEMDGQSFTSINDEVSKLKRMKAIRRMATGRQGRQEVGSAGHAARSVANDAYAVGGT